MTPEERYAQIYTDPEGYCKHRLGWVNGPCSECEIEAIRAAVVEERETCLAIIQRMLTTHHAWTLELLWPVIVSAVRYRG